MEEVLYGRKRDAVALVEEDGVLFIRIGRIGEVDRDFPHVDSRIPDPHVVLDTAVLGAGQFVVDKAGMGEIAPSDVVAGDDGGLVAGLFVLEGSRAAVAIHDMAGIAFDACLGHTPLNWADTLFQPATLVQDQHAGIDIQLSQLICYEYAAGARADNNDIILFHFISSSTSAIRTRSSMSCLTPLIS